MKIRRFVAKDMRTALAQIKEELGVEAVIMSNKKIAEGVELMAAVDYSQPAPDTKKRVNQPAPTTNNSLNEDVVSLSSAAGKKARNIAQPQEQSTQHTTEESTAPADSLSALLNRRVQQSTGVDSLSMAAQSDAQSSVQVVANEATDEQSIEQQFKLFTQKLQQPTEQNLHDIDVNNGVSSNRMNNDAETKRMATEDDGFGDRIEPSFQSNTNSSNQVASNDLISMQKEMASIRQLLEHQVSGLMWQDFAQKEPQRAVLVNRLMSMGLHEQIADQIAGYIPHNCQESEAWEHAKELLVKQLNTTNNDIINRGGVVSLVGPTGVGKTTTIAKLAARFAQIHGADQVALISTDTFRIAGYEQLNTYGKIIGCNVKLAKTPEELEELLQLFTHKKLVLIDTAGMGQRDMRLAQHLTSLVTSSRVRIRNYLVLAANTQQRVLQENVERFKKVPLSGCIYTKLDESVSIGEIISTSIQNGLPIGYLTDGQRVPEDIKVANIEKLVTLADKMANKFQPQHSVAFRTMPMNPMHAEG